MKTKTILLTLSALMFLITGTSHAQAEQPAQKHRLGIGLGYNFNSVMGDSIRPAEISLRFQINDKHTLQAYVPIGFNRLSTQDGTNDVKKQTLWDVGIGYDYTFYTSTHLIFFCRI